VSADPRRLAVLVDGTPMVEKEALALWERFSAWMEEHRGDLAGFAVQEGYASVHPGVDGDQPVLRASRTAGQRPYAAVRGQPPASEGKSAQGDRASVAAGGSDVRQNTASKPDSSGGHPRDFTKKPGK